MTKYIYECEGEHHIGKMCDHHCVAMLLSKTHSPKNCLIFTEGYGLSKPKWKLLGTQE